MKITQLYDARREPPGWWQIIQRGQYVAFSQHAESGAPCDVDGVVFASPDAVTCAIFDSLSEATAFCQARVEQVPGVRFEIFDAAGRTSPPLLTVVHSSREGGLEGNRHSRRVATWGAAALLVTAPILVWYDWAKHDGLLVLPTIAGLNFLVFGARLLLLNRMYASTEQSRRQRLAQHGSRREP
jgi:hypothetical protein